MAHRAARPALARERRRRSGADAIEAASIAEAPAGPGDAAPALVIDGLGGRIDERALLHTYNGIAERGGYLLLTTQTPPARWPLALPDLASRLRLAPAVALGLPDDALLAALMLKLFADRQIAIAPEVSAYVVPRIERTFAAVASLVEALDRAALAEGRPVTVPLVRAVLALGESGADTPPEP